MQKGGFRLLVRVDEVGALALSRSEPSGQTEEYDCRQAIREMPIPSQRSRHRGRKKPIGPRHNQACDRKSAPENKTLRAIASICSFREASGAAGMDFFPV